MKALVVVLITLLSAVLGGEVIARYLDPFGIGRARTDTTNLHFTFQPDGTRLYKLTPGAYTFSNWTLTVNVDTFRRVPDTNERADCTIALLGDSVTFGFGVSDGETWANILAQRFPDVHILNTGVSGYNTVLIERTASTVQADGYFYLMVGNDAQVKTFDNLHGREPVTIYASLKDYLLYIARGHKETTPVDREAFKTAYTQLMARGNVSAVSLVGVGDAPLSPDAIPLPMYTATLSVVDGHPNAQGNVEIADVMEVEFAALVERVC